MSTTDDKPMWPKHETRAERINRNWNELLQELRVIQAGTQIITGFLLAAVFQSGFVDLGLIERCIYLGLLGAAIITTVLGLTPVMIHRRLFRQGAKVSILRLGDRLLRATMIGLGVTLSGIALLVFDLVAGLLAGAVAAAAVVALLLVLWWLLPSRTHARIEELRDDE